MNLRYTSLTFLLCAVCLGYSPSITSFNTGQVSPFIENRPDFQKYSASLRKAENVLVTTQGPLERRPGTKYVASSPVRLSGTDPNLPHTVAISTAMDLQKMGTFSATFNSASGTITAGETVTFQTTKSAFVVDITYDTGTTGTIWWCTVSSGAIADSDVLSHGADTVTVNAVPTNNMSKNYYLINDIDASETSSWYSGLGFVPVGDKNGSPSFTGTLDGCGYTISNLYENSDIVGFRGGLFNICDGATFYNLTIADANITSTYGLSGILAGQITDTTVQAVTVSGVLHCSSQSGGLVGTGSGNTILYCVVEDFTLTAGAANDNLGLFSGRCAGDYNDCFADGTITGITGGNQYVGGFIGGYTSLTAAFLRCSVTGTMPGQDEGQAFTKGGFAGGVLDTATFSGCYYLSTLNEKPFGGEDEIQTITAVGANPTGGAYTVTFDGYTVSLAYNASEATAQAAFDARYGAGAIEVEGDYPITGNRTQQIYFRKQYTRTNVATAVVDSSGLTGAGVGVWTIATTNEAVYPSISPVPQGAASLTNPLLREPIRLISFEYSTDDAYVIEVGNQYMRFYRDDE